jgi:hypothetical protein
MNVPGATVLEEYPAAISTTEETPRGAAVARRAPIVTEQAAHRDAVTIR